MWETHPGSSALGNAWWRARWATIAPFPSHSGTGCCSPPHSQTASRWPTQQRSPESWHQLKKTFNLFLFGPEQNHRWGRSWPLTCCWPPCRPAGLPAPESPGEAGWGWSDSSSGSGVPVWLSQFAHQSRRGWDREPRLLGWYETLAGSYWPKNEELEG